MPFHTYSSEPSEDRLSSREQLLHSTCHRELLLAHGSDEEGMGEEEQREVDAALWCGGKNTKKALDEELDLDPHP